MSKLSADKFDEFYEAIYGYKPFPWQTRLAKDVCAGSWPETIALPTAAGKTACIEIAMFALACGAANAPRRILFVVDRRIVVDQAFRHAEMLAKKLKVAKEGILKDVADALLAIGQGENPLEYYALRGGMYRETAWTKSPLQPTIITSTVDQVGSRLLFRGYGVSDGMLPIHAALVGNDALIILDEAHCAKPFDQTLQAVKKYRDWNKSLAPFHCVTMTATPISEDDVFRENEVDDWNHEVLGRRIKASKPARLVPVESAKGKNGIKPLLAELEKQARELSAEGFACVGIIVNRVKTARELQKKLSDDAVLLTGRMRPLDRDLVFETLQPLLSGHEGNVPKFVIGTQCLECGADFDFHALVTECASLDALRQRFGRLNRIANPARTLSAKAVIVIRGDETTDTETDPIYGKSLAETWHWLNTRAVDGVIDFGIAALKATIGEENISHLNAPSSDAPVLFPAHLDCWVQTNPKPTPDPDPALFLHGPKERILDVKVVFRDDLGNDPNQWIDIVALCPPSSSEAVAVPIKTFKRWLAGESIDDSTSDVEGEIAVENEKDKLEPSDRRAVCWQGQRESQLVNDPKQIRPERVYVVPCQAEDVGSLADFIELPPRDYSELAYKTSRDKLLLKLRNLTLDPEDSDFEDLLTEEIKAEKARRTDLTKKEREAFDKLFTPGMRNTEQHPTGGFVVSGFTRIGQFQPTYLNDSEASESYRSRKRHVTLVEHSRGVADHAECFAKGCGLDVEQFRTAGLWHDLGKLDPRFQAMLKQTSPRTAVGTPWAKSKKSPRTKKERADARLVHRYPSGARHELLSTAMLECETSDALLLHLIATHHGHARPFADAVTENEAVKEPFVVKFFDRSFAIDSARQDIAKWNATLPERFWSIVREHGWWGSAYLEGVFRIADQAQSALEQEIPEDKQCLAEVVTSTPLAAYVEPSKLFSLALPGLDGSNPLGFMAALGTLRLANGLHPGTKLHWKFDNGWQPVLGLSTDTTPEEFINNLHQRVHRTVDAGSALEADKQHKAYRLMKKETDKAADSLKKRNLRGAERELAVAIEVTPLRVKELVARAEWLASLESAVPAPFLSLGKSISVTFQEFTAFAMRAQQKLVNSGILGRDIADFVSAFGSEACIDKNGKIIPTDFQLITGSGHQFFLDTFGKLMQSITAEQLHRALFETWKYCDPRMSFRWDPIDDRRYALSKEDPSNNEVRTEHGANLLAAYALPFFPIAPTERGARTTGFAKLKNESIFSWPVWTEPFGIDTIQSLLQLYVCDGRGNTVWEQFGIHAKYQVRKFEVGTAPLNKFNFCPAVMI